METNPTSPTPIPIFSNFTSPFEYSPKKSEYNSSTRKPLSLWPGMYHSPVTSTLWETRSKIFERLLDPPLDAPPQSELLTKKPSQSRMTILYNISSDYTLREQYRDPWNEVRIGKLLEDLDALAGTISVKVDVGDFLRFKSSVLYTEFQDSERPLIHVEVVAHVTRPELRSSEVSNGFCFTFTFRPEAKAMMNNGHRIRKVVPVTEEEACKIAERMDADML